MSIFLSGQPVCNSVFQFWGLGGFFVSCVDAKPEFTSLAMYDIISCNMHEHTYLSGQASAGYWTAKKCLLVNLCKACKKNPKDSMFHSHQQLFYYSLGPFIYYIRTNFRISDPPTPHPPVRTDYDVTMTTIHWRTHGA